MDLFNTHLNNINTTQKYQLINNKEIYKAI